jgi:acetyltransferase-like isoleucine patch superfamily enzyme
MPDPNKLGRDALLALRAFAPKSVGAALGRAARELANAGRKVTRHPHVEFGARTLVDDGCTFEDHVKIGPDSSVFHSRFGRYSYAAFRLWARNAGVGRFTTIGPNVILGMGTHPSRDFVAVHPVFFSPAVRDAFAIHAFNEHAPVNIGSDVWIGANAFVAPGVTIGDGAIVAAGAVVMRDVEPYEIVGGAPSKRLRMRFEAHDVEFLRALLWWELPDDELRLLAADFNDVRALRARLGDARPRPPLGPRGKLPLRDRLQYQVPLILPGFSRLAAVARPQFDAPAVTLADGPRDPTQWYGEFRRRVFDAMNERQFLPIYRMGDGEYSMLVGPQDDPVQRVRRAVSRALGRQGAHKSGTPAYGFEEYTAPELAQTKALLPKLLARIAERGILALALHPLNPGFARFIRPTLDAFDDIPIDVTERNYFPFYFVYALLCGPDRHVLLRNRRVLIVTGPTHGKFEKLAAALGRLGVADLQFVPCHPNKSMLHEIDLSGVKTPVDLVLVGAGIGAANVLMQLEGLSTVCIDSGYCLSALGDPALPRRAYAMPDDEWDPTKLADIPQP